MPPSNVFRIEQGRFPLPVYICAASLRIYITLAFRFRIAVIAFLCQRLSQEMSGTTMGCMLEAVSLIVWGGSETWRTSFWSSLPCRSCFSWGPHEGLFHAAWVLYATLGVFFTNQICRLWMIMIVMIVMMMMMVVTSMYDCCYCCWGWCCCFVVVVLVTIWCVGFYFCHVCFSLFRIIVVTIAGIIGIIVLHYCICLFCTDVCYRYYRLSV